RRAGAARGLGEGGGGTGTSPPESQPVASDGQTSPPTFVAVRYSTLFSWNGVSSGCFDRTSAAMPAMCGVAKLLPVQTSRPPPFQATSTSTPRAKNSTGGAGL